MLKAKRFDYFPRPIIAIWNEQKNQNEYKDLIVDSTFVLHYPTAFYFFVAPKQQKLADVITKGLERSITDGSFERVFNKYFTALIQQTNVKNRIIFELENPLIKSHSLPLNRPNLWYKP
jgi:ABC-type amino acid transport substrate-binding protein